ncbi:hypothetical protein D3C81_2073580 [compost metagenome]
MQRLNAAQDIANPRCLGRVIEAVLLVPLGQGRQVRAQGVAGQLCTIGGQVTHDVFTGGRQHPAPLRFKVFNGLRIAALGAVASSCLQVSLG